MKLAKQIAVWTLLVLASATVCLAQDNLFSISIGGSRQYISVQNATGDHSPIIVEIDRHKGPVLYEGQSFTRSISAFSNREEVLINIFVCKGIEKTYAFESAPTWPDNMDRPDGLPITDAFLHGRPTKDEIDDRVDAIKHFMKHQPGGRDYIAAIEAWKHEVDDHGIAQIHATCESPTALQSITFNRVIWGSYGNVETALMVVGEDGKYSIQNPPRWVY